MIRVGIVAEGPSDWMVLEELILSVEPDAEFVHIRPDMTLDSGSAHGWKGVRAWCRDMGPRLEAFLTGIPEYSIHLLVVHVDCSMAHNVGASYPCPPADATSKALREVVVDWLQRPSLPGFVILATPSQSSDTWVVAALDPPYEGSSVLECDLGVERELVRRRLLRLRDGEVKKQATRYRPLVKQMAGRIGEVCATCPEAGRFRAELVDAISERAAHSSLVGSDS
jgi:hypothetical protein